MSAAQADSRTAPKPGSAPTIVRRASWRDAIRLARLSRRCFPQDLRWRAPIAVGASWWLRQLRAHKSESWVVTTPQDLIALLLLVQEREGHASFGPPTSGRYWLDLIGVHPDHQRCGLARVLLALAEERARALGRRAVALAVDPVNEPALSLYRAQGWAERQAVSGTIHFVRHIENRAA